MKARDAVILLAETSVAACENGCDAHRLVVFDAAAKALSNGNFVRAALMEGGGCK